MVILIKVKNRLFIILTVIFLIFGLVAGIVVITQPTIFTGRASSNDPLDPQLSEIWNTNAKFAAKADGKDIVEITVILLNKQTGISDKTVELVFFPQGPLLVKNFINSDAKGFAKFQATATRPGKYKVNAMVEGVLLNKTLNLEFR